MVCHQKPLTSPVSQSVTLVCLSVYQDTFLKSTHTLRAQKWVPKRIISRITAPPVPFLAPIRSATAGRALTRRPFVDRVGNRRVTDDFVSPVTVEYYAPHYL